MLNIGVTFLSYLFTLVLGFLVCWYFFPRLIPVLVDSRTGQIMYSLPNEYDGIQRGADAGNLNNQNKPANPASPPASPTPTPHSSKGKL